MGEGSEPEQDDLQHRQTDALYPVGRSLRHTFPPLDGDELQPRITSLMVALSHQPYERAQAVAPPPPEKKASRPPSILRHLIRLFRSD